MFERNLNDKFCILYISVLEGFGVTKLDFINCIKLLQVLGNFFILFIAANKEQGYKFEHWAIKGLFLLAIVKQNKGIIFLIVVNWCVFVIRKKQLFIQESEQYREGRIILLFVGTFLVAYLYQRRVFCRQLDSFRKQICQK
eukprot:TRINITY_DN3571_c0_g1_i2.p3 TRINITY_DN3571_c0_g1~~TRINITY_DN3571_c0_g1_i2.p3  ORF type:complete len:141 (-),score=4.37 TRINITY_DN3571_c0_g1_i2:578-1000(-)